MRIKKQITDLITNELKIHPEKVNSFEKMSDWNCLLVAAAQSAQ